MTKILRTPVEPFNIIARVKSVHGLNGEDTEGKGPCKYYKPGDKQFFKNGKIEGTICHTALATMLHKILPMRVGLDFPWVKEGIAEHTCSDNDRPVVFEIFIDESNSDTD